MAMTGGTFFICFQFLDYDSGAKNDPETFSQDISC